LSPAVHAKVANRWFGSTLSGEASDRIGELHYPDLVLVVPEGRVVMEYQLDPPSRWLLDATLEAYARQAHVATVVYFCEDRAVGGVLRAARARSGLEGRMRVETATLDRMAL
jgi:hypothetical protein